MVIALKDTQVVVTMRSSLKVSETKKTVVGWERKAVSHEGNDGREKDPGRLDTSTHSSLSCHFSQTYTSRIGAGKPNPVFERHRRVSRAI